MARVLCRELASSETPTAVVYQRLFVNLGLNGADQGPFSPMYRIIGGLQEQRSAVYCLGQSIPNSEPRGANPWEDARGCAGHSLSSNLAAIAKAGNGRFVVQNQGLPPARSRSLPRSVQPVAASFHFPSITRFPSIICIGRFLPLDFRGIPGIFTLRWTHLTNLGAFGRDGECRVRGCPKCPWKTHGGTE
jgi:hypothetical protein